MTDASGNLEGLPVDVAVPILFVVSELVEEGRRDFAVAQIEKLSPYVASLLRESSSSALGRYLPAECKV